MKLKIKFTISEIDNKHFAIPVNTDGNSFAGVFEVNETSEFILECLNIDICKENLIAKVMTKFGCNKEEAIESVELIIDGLEKNRLLI